jgi:putative ATP-dependent endonuclease of OLD family
MRISKIRIKNYRNLKDINLEINRLAIFIGENNSGKSNLLKAITLPFMNDDVGSLSKNLGWQDINNEAKAMYFSYIQENIVRIRNEEVEIEEFISILPYVDVEVIFTPDGSDEYFIQYCINIVFNTPMSS